MRTFFPILAVLTLVSFAWNGVALAENGTGLQTSIAVDVVGQAGVAAGSGASDALRVREAEALFYAPIDHIFDGILNFAAHHEAGRSFAVPELHEAYFGSTKFIPRSRFRVGQFFLGFGRLNQFHRHDWPFTSAPRVHREFFDETGEGVLDTGVEYTFLFPLPFFLEATAGLTNGFVFGHRHVEENRPLVPTNYLRLATYASLPWDGGMQVGLNYVGRRGSEGLQRTMVGLDLTAKWKEVKAVKFLLQSEIWYRTLTPSGGSTEEALGFYLYPQYQLTETLFLGLRLDYFAVLNQKVPVLNTPYKNMELNFVPNIAYKPSEFMTLRLSYNHRPQYLGDAAAQVAQFVELQGVFLLGSHPAHDF